MAKSRWLRIQTVNRVFALTLTLHFHVIGAFGDFRNAPKDLDHNLFLGHKIWRGGLKPHPLPCQTTCFRTDEQNSAGLT
jgi:hypothetical protein